MRKIRVNNNFPSYQTMKHTAKVLSSCGLVVYPTDTAYGLGANALNEEAITKLYELKGRDFSKPTHVIVKDWNMIEELCVTNNQAQKLYNKFMPGPLTMVLLKKDIVPNILVANGKTLGVRIPNSQVTKLISLQITFPFTTPSANRSNEPTPYSIEEVKQVLDIEKVDLILDAGPLIKIAPSTIVDISNNKLKIVREGPITKEEIEIAIRK